MGPRHLTLAVFLLLAGGARYALHETPVDDEAGHKEVLLLPPGEVIRSLDLGHHTLAADLLFIRANLYYGQHILTDQELPWLSSFIDTLLRVDPRFGKAYIWGAMVTLFPRRVMHYTPPDLVLRANRILEAGMRRFPRDHRFPLRLAFNHYYELGDADAAIPYFERAVATPGAPGWIRQKLVDLYTKKGRRELARRTLLEIIAEETDPVLSGVLRARLARVMEKPEREELVAARRELVRRWRDRYAYLSFDLYLLIKEP
jgi:tetratricopeptide (TPR) repeat protein